MKIMGYWIYAKRTNFKIESRKENHQLLHIIELVAKKIECAILNGNPEKTQTLFDPLNGMIYRSATLHFIAKKASDFVKNIAPQNYSGRVGKYVSKRQMSRLLNNNSHFTSIHAISILITILQLLLMDENSMEFKSISKKTEAHSIGVRDIQNYEKNVDLAVSFLKKHITNLLDNNLNYCCYAPGTHFICAYIIESYDCLNQIMHNGNAYNALRAFAVNNPNTLQLLIISPGDMPGIPN